MMDAQLRDIRERGEPLAALWASEETIYGRFGYGLASPLLNLDADRRDVSVRPRAAGARSRAARGARGGAARVPARLRPFARTRPGMIVALAGLVAAAPPRRRARDGGAGRAARPGASRARRACRRATRSTGSRRTGSTPENWTKTVRVIEAFGDRRRRDARRLAVPPRDRLDRPGRRATTSRSTTRCRCWSTGSTSSRLTVWDGLWLRLVDVPAALAGRAYASDGRVTVEVVADPHFPENVGSLDGRRRRGAPRASPAGRAAPRRRARVRVPRWALVRAARRAGRVEEAARGAARPGRRRVPQRGRALVHGDLLTSDRRHRCEWPGRRPRRRGAGPPRDSLPRGHAERRAPSPTSAAPRSRSPGYDEPDDAARRARAGRSRLHGLDARAARQAHRAPPGFVDVAIAAAVARIVYLSFVGAGPDAAFVHARSHGATEAMLADSGIPFTAVRNGMYADEIASWFDRDGRITGPGGRRPHQPHIQAGARRGDRRPPRRPDPR